MRNKSFKISIIDDYTVVLNAKNFFEFSLCSAKLTENEIFKIKDLLSYSENLLQTYKKIMFKLGLIDLSLAILDKQMLSSYFCDGKTIYIDNAKILTKLQEFEENLKEIGKNLKIKLKKMELNSFEMNYLNIEKLSKSIDIN